MLNFVIFFYKCNTFKLKKVTKGFLYTEIIMLCKFVYTRNSKTYFLFLFTHIKPPILYQTIILSISKFIKMVY